MATSQFMTPNQYSTPAKTPIPGSGYGLWSPTGQQIGSSQIPNKVYSAPPIPATNYSQPQQSQSQPQQQSQGINTSAAESANQRAIEAAISAYEAQKQALQNQIPEYQKANDLRMTGLDQSLTNFNQTADREQASRVAGINDTIGTINDQYTRAGRSTQATAKSLARQLRNQFASLGTLDSTQYRDMNIEQSNNLLQGVGDIRREQAGKLTTAEREKNDIEKYYAEQRLQQQKDVELKKDQIRQDTNSFIREVMDKVNITDKQKVQAIESAKSQAQQQILELSLKQQEVNRQIEKDNQEMALKKQELASKGYSSAYTEAKDTRAAITAATAAAQKYQDMIGRSLTASELKQVFTNFGVADKIPDFNTAPVDSQQDPFQ